MRKSTPLLGGSTRSFLPFPTRPYPPTPQDPQSVLKLRCLFLKLKSVLELPLLRISQIGSPDVYSVGEFYSQELVGYVRGVVEVIPKSMFSILTRIIAVQTVRGVVWRERERESERRSVLVFCACARSSALAHARCD